MLTFKQTWRLCVHVGMRRIFNSGLSIKEWKLYFSCSLFSSIEQDPPPAVAEWEVQQCRLFMCTHRAHIKAKSIQCFKLALFSCILHSRDDFYDFEQICLKMKYMDDYWVGMPFQHVYFHCDTEIEISKVYVDTENNLYSKNFITTITP